MTWGSSSVPYYINASNLSLPESAVIVVLQAGASTWHDQSTANSSFAYAGQTRGASAVNNGRNEIMFRIASNGGTVALLGGALRRLGLLRRKLRP